MSAAARGRTPWNSRAPSPASAPSSSTCRTSCDSLRDIWKRAGLADRVALVAGDYDRDDLGSGFDLVFLSAIIHSNSPDGNRALIRRGVAALNPTGRLVIQDFIVDEARTGPPFGVLFALNMLVGTAAGDTYTESEARQWMTEAGLSGVVRTDTAFGTTLLTGRKAGRR